MSAPLIVLDTEVISSANSSAVAQRHNLRATGRDTEETALLRAFWRRRR